jgi:hypothetical protein
LLHARASIYAYQKAGWHIAVIEEDGAVYKSNMEPLIVEVVNEVSKKQRFVTESAVVSDEEEEIPIIVLWNTFYK